MINFMRFPDPCNANTDGLLASGGDLSVDTLVSAYAQGIFPWFNHDQPILWWSPDPRMVLFPEQVNISKSLRKSMRKTNLNITCNTAFSDVIRGCALRGQNLDTTAQELDQENLSEDTWISDAMRHAYTSLFEMDYAHSIEVWQDQQLVGGLYGVALGGVFFGESMFSSVSNASKFALVALCQHLQKLDIKIIDCQIPNDHLYSMGAGEIDRNDFLKHLTSIDIQAPHCNFSDGFNPSLR